MIVLLIIFLFVVFQIKLINHVERRKAKLAAEGKEYTPYRTPKQAETDKRIKRQRAERKRLGLPLAARGAWYMPRFNTRNGTHKDVIGDVDHTKRVPEKIMTANWKPKGSRKRKQKSESDSRDQDDKEEEVTKKKPVKRRAANRKEKTSSRVEAELSEALMALQHETQAQNVNQTFHQNSYQQTTAQSDNQSSYWSLQQSGATAMTTVAAVGSPQRRSHRVGSFRSKAATTTTQTSVNDPNTASGTAYPYPWQYQSQSNSYFNQQ